MKTTLHANTFSTPQWLTLLVALLLMAWPLVSLAQAAPSAPTDSAGATMTDGEVKKVNPDTGKVTIKHGPIAHMDMPGMTMVFTAKDKNMLTKLQPGDKIKEPLHNSGEAVAVGSGWVARRLFAANSRAIGKKNNAADRPSPTDHRPQGVMQRLLKFMVVEENRKMLVTDIQPQ